VVSSVCGVSQLVCRNFRVPGEIVDAFRRT
jgi:hypothetical protein